MPANNFEDKAKQLLDELNIRPNEEVWQQVEKRIREKKRRRWFIILPLAAVMLGGYFIIQQNDNGSKSDLNIPVKNQNNTQAAGDDSINDKTTAKLNETKNKDDKEKSENAGVNAEKENAVTLKDDKKSMADINTADDYVANNKPAADKNKTNLADGDIKLKDVAVKKPFKSKTALRRKTKDNDKDKNKTAGLVKVKSEEDAAAKPVKDNDAVKMENESLVKKPDENDPLVEANKAEEKKPVQEIKTEVAVTDSAVATSQPKKTGNKGTVKNKWKRGIMFSAGLSNTGSHSFNLFSGEKALLDIQNSASGPGPINYFASPHKNTFALQAGVFVQKNISKKGSLSIGLNYALYQSKITVGAALDSNIGLPNAGQYTNVYRGNSSFTKNNSYTNRLHYIEVPVNYSLQLNRSKTFPVYWDAGVSFGYLMGTNYLHFDSAANGIYFEDKNLVSKFNFNLQTGFSFSLLNKTNTPVKLGPLLQAGLTDILKSSNEKKFVYYGGVRLQMLLGGKKKK